MIHSVSALTIRSTGRYLRGIVPLLRHRVRSFTNSTVVVAPVSSVVRHTRKTHNHNLGGQECYYRPHS